MNRATRITSFPGDEIPKIKQKFLNADYPYRFINSVINNFQEKSEGTDDYIILPGFFDVPKKVVLVDIPYCSKNEELSKRFVKKFDFSLIINTIFVLSGSLRKLNSCFNSKVKISIHHV